MPSALYYQQSGSGPPLLLIHGLMVSGAMYLPVRPALEAHHRIILPDLRGHGRSGELPGPYNVEQLAQDLAQLLDDLQVDAVDVLGYSQGGAVAQQLVHDNPGRVRSLVLACTFACNMLSFSERVEGRLSPWLVRLLGMRRLAGPIVDGIGGRRLPPEAARWLRETLAANDTGAMVAALEAMNAFDSRPWLQEIKCRTLVIAGAQDNAVPLVHAQMLAQGIPGARLRVVDGAGHTLIWTHTELFVQSVESFLASLNRV